jgi:hypothetical protein
MAMNVPVSAPAAPRRMTLAAVKSGRIAQPVRVLMYGPEGLGKSTFASNAPAPIFLGAEVGTEELDVARFPEPHSWTDVKDAIAELRQSDAHRFQTLVIDTLDWLEPLVWRAVCEAGRKSSIEDFGYGKGYTAALEEWRSLVHSLEGLRREKRMHVVMLAHSHVRPYKNPEGDDYDRYTLKIHDKAGGLLKEWCDAVLFANYETHVLKDGSRGKGFGGGTRVMHTERRAAWDAKNRFGLPEKMPLDWAEFYAAVEASRTDGAVESLRSELTAQLAQLPDSEEARRKSMVAWLDTNDGRNADKLRAAINKVQTFLGTVSTQQAGAQ